eukprot:m.73367 g.73367  ORF g.73367 m.73367 type:complete len:112 (-) comp14340_c0_seq1:59-394(-)
MHTPFIQSSKHFSFSHGPWLWSFPTHVKCCRFVQEHARGKGLGVGLMRRLAQIAMENNCSRFQWQVIDWNSSSIDFYKQKLGARERVEQGDAKWLNYIVDGPALAKLAAAE